MYGILLALCLIGNPVEATKPVRPRPTMYVGISDTFESKLLKQEIEIDWISVIKPNTDEIAENTCRMLAATKFEMDKKVKIKIVTPDDDDTVPYDWPVYRFSRYQKWEKFPKKTFSYSTCPTLTLDYLISRQFVDEFRKDLEEKRRAYDIECSNINSYILKLNSEILRRKYGDKIFNPVIEYTAIYQFRKNKWYKIKTPSNKLFLTHKEKESIKPVEDNEDTSSSNFYFANGYISEYNMSGWSMSGTKNEWKSVRIPTDGLNVYLSFGAFPNVDVEPSPPWEEKYSFIPF